MSKTARGGKTSDLVRSPNKFVPALPDPYSKWIAFFRLSSALCQTNRLFWPALKKKKVKSKCILKFKSYQ